MKSCTLKNNKMQTPPINTVMSFLEKVTTNIEESHKSGRLNDIWKLREEALNIPGLGQLIKKHNQSTYFTVVDSDSQLVLTWLFEQLAHGTSSSNYHYAGLIFILNLIFEPDVLWKELHLSGFNLPNSMRDFSKTIITTANSTIAPRYMSEYHTDEAKKHYQKILSSNNWSLIYEDLHRESEGFRYSISFLTIHAIYMLMYFENSLLMSTLNNQKDILFLWGMMDILGKETALKIAIMAKSDILEFSAISSVLPFIDTNELSTKEEALLCKVFSKILGNQDKFKHWMHILNRYPTRYPQIQRSLGQSLGMANSEEAVITYLTSLRLIHRNTSDNCRLCVANCLEQLEHYSSTDLALLTWKKAYEIWDEWNFDFNEKSTYLFDIKASILDYAVTKYFLDYLSEDERIKSINTQIEKLKLIDNVWHSSQSKYQSYWHLCLSRLQPLYHIHHLKLDHELPVLMQDRFYTLELNDDADYIQLKLS